MDLEVAVRQIRRHQPRVKPLAREIELHEAQRLEIRHPDGVVIDDDVERQREAREGIDVVDFLWIRCRPEHVDASARPIEREDQPVRTHRDGVHAAELSGALAVPAKLPEIVQVGVEDHHAMIVEAIRDQDAPVRQERHILRLGEVRAVAARHVLLAERLQQLLAVIGKHVDGVERFVDDPHAPLAIVGADAETMRARARRAFAERVPLRPALLDVAVAIERVQAVLPHAAIGQRQDVHLDRSREAGEFRRHGRRQAELAALRDEDPIR